MLAKKDNILTGYQSLVFFILSSLIFYSIYLSEIYLVPNAWDVMFWSPIFYLSVINICLKLCFSGFLYNVLVRAIFLGFLFATGIRLAHYDDGWKLFGIYLALMAFFHFSEFFATAITNPNTLTVDSYLLNHSLQYALAAIGCTIEWAIEFYFIPSIKRYYYISYLGLAMCLIGEFARKCAMYTAKTSFNHQVQYQKSIDHILITHGIYSKMRHPSYAGWFCWAVGTQVVLLNPACFIAFIVSSWIYFNDRIFYEEYTLLRFFGDHYQVYQNTVPTGIPFIKGYLSVDAY